MEGRLRVAAWYKAACVCGPGAVAAVWTAHGRVHPDWLRRLGRRREVVFIEDGHNAAVGPAVVKVAVRRKEFIRVAKDLGILLRQHGMQFGQGWLFGRPMPFAEVVRQLQEAAQQEGEDARITG